MSVDVSCILCLSLQQNFSGHSGPTNTDRLLENQQRQESLLLDSQDGIAYGCLWMLMDLIDLLMDLLIYIDLIDLIDLIAF